MELVEGVLFIVVTEQTYYWGVIISESDHLSEHLLEFVVLAAVLFFITVEKHKD